MHFCGSSATKYNVALNISSPWIVMDFTDKPEAALVYNCKFWSLPVTKEQKVCLVNTSHKKFNLMFT